MGKKNLVNNRSGNKPHSHNKQISDNEIKKMALFSLLNERKALKPKNDKQKDLIKTIKDKNIEIIVVGGSAGCGKTIVTLSECLNLLLDSKSNFNQLHIFKSVTTLKGEEIGYLPGDIDDKMKYFLLSYFNQVEKLIGKNNLEKLVAQDFIKIVPLGFIRGLSMTPNQIVIVDEMQNISIENTKTILTRMEEGGKLILMGDCEQQDSKGSNGLKFLLEKFKGVDEKIQVLEFNDLDIVRNPLITKILKVFNEQK